MTRVRRRRFLATALAGLAGGAAGPRAAGAASSVLERSYWVHASLGLFTQKHYFGPDYPATPPPTRAEVASAARLLAGPYAANRLYLVYHREMPLDAAREVFTWWRESTPPEVEIVPALVLRMYDQAQSRVFPAGEARSLAQFFRERINPERVAVYDIYPNREQGEDLQVLAGLFPRGMIRLGQQPEEPLREPYAAVVQDTWSGFCHGTRNREDWEQPGFGAVTLRRWVTARNGGRLPVVWNLIVVAWDYAVPGRGGYPGYDDAEKNMPLPAGRNRLAQRLIREAAQPAVFGGFSSDLYILNENSRSAAHDGKEGAFYQTLKRGEEYRGYYAQPLQEIAAIYRELR